MTRDDSLALGLHWFGASGSASRGAASRLGSGRSVPLGEEFGGKGEGRKGIERPGNVEKFGVCVDVRCESRVGMAHRGLSRPKGNAPFAQECTEGRSQGVNVDCPASLVALGDSSEGEIAIEDSDQSLRNREDEGIGRESGRNRLAAAASIGLERGELAGEPGSEIGDEVGAEDDAVAFAVLLVGRIELGVRDRPVEPELIDRERTEFVPTEPGQDEGLVDQGSLSGRVIRVAPVSHPGRWRSSRPVACPFGGSMRRAGGDDGPRRAI